MKKSKLIELLQDIEGDPDIKLWNGFVGDWADIDPKFVEQELVKESWQHKYNCLVWEWQRDNNTFNPPPVGIDNELREYAKQQFKQQQWELPNPWVESKDYNEWYGKQKKRIVILNHKERGKTHSDRVGSMSY